MIQQTKYDKLKAIQTSETKNCRYDHQVIALPHDRLREVLKKYNRVEK
jgi:hypothetical protein